MITQKLTGAQKVAILILGFGEDISSDIFRHLSMEEVKKIGLAMTQINSLDQEVIDGVFSEFYEILQPHSNVLPTKSLIANDSL